MVHRGCQEGRRPGTEVMYLKGQLPPTQEKLVAQREELVDLNCQGNQLLGNNWS